MGFLSALKLALQFGFYDITGYGRNRKRQREFIESQKEALAFDKIGSSQEHMEMFFQPDVLRRLIYCPQINVDMTDSWGMFGYEPGFILIRGLRYSGVRTLADKAALSGYSTGTRVRVRGIEIPQISHFDYFPRHKFQYDLITPRYLPRFYDFLNNPLDTHCKDIGISKN